MVSGVSHLSIILLFALGLLLGFFSHLAIIAFTIHVVCVCDWRKQKRKSNKE